MAGSQRCDHLKGGALEEDLKLFLCSSIAGGLKSQVCRNKIHLNLY